MHDVLSAGSVVSVASRGGKSRQIGPFAAESCAAAVASPELTAPAERLSQGGRCGGGSGGNRGFCVERRGDADTFARRARSARFELQAYAVSLVTGPAPRDDGIDAAAPGVLCQRQAKDYALAGIVWPVRNRAKPAARDVNDVKAVHNVSAIGVQANAAYGHVQPRSRVTPAFHRSCLLILQHCLYTPARVRVSDIVGKSDLCRGALS